MALIVLDEEVGGRVFAVIREMVAALGSQTEVAHRTGLSQSYISKIVRGQVEPGAMKLKTMEDFVTNLRVDVEWLTGDEFDPSDWSQHSQYEARLAEERVQRVANGWNLDGGIEFLATEVLRDPTEERRVLLLAGLVLNDFRVVLANAVRDAVVRKQHDSVRQLGQLLAEQILKDETRRQANAASAESALSELAELAAKVRRD